jgi:hypothetical protein
MELDVQEINRFLRYVSVWEVGTIKTMMGHCEKKESKCGERYS